MAFFPKTFFNQGCGEAWRCREECFRIYKSTESIEDKINWKRAKATATNAHVNMLSINTKSSMVWLKIRSIRGKPHSKLNILKMNGILYSSVAEITEKLAQTFQKITSNMNYDPQFLDHKYTAEQRQFNFESDNNEECNRQFTIDALQKAIVCSKRNSPGPDEVSNMMLKAVPEITISYILKVFNIVWDECYFHNWRIATIIPIPNTGKDHSNPSNYRPISLTSCCVRH